MSVNNNAAPFLAGYTEEYFRLHIANEKTTSEKRTKMLTVAAKVSLALLGLILILSGHFIKAAMCILINELVLNASGIPYFSFPIFSLTTNKSQGSS